jgi:hypothetical protein
MNRPWSIADVEVVGYADVLKANMLPSVVPPVFRVKDDPDCVLVPPYLLNGNLIWNATELCAEELFSLQHERRVTLFSDAVPARADHELWVDQQFGRHYEPREEADQTLHNIAKRHCELSKQSLAGGDLESAERLSSIAASADDRLIDSLLIKAAIQRLQHNELGVDVLVHLAGPMLGESEFRKLLRVLLEENPAAIIPRQVGRTGSPMRGMAALRPAA